MTPSERRRKCTALALLASMAAIAAGMWQWPLTEVRRARHVVAHGDVRLTAPPDATPARAIQATRDVATPVAVRQAPAAAPLPATVPARLDDDVLSSRVLTVSLRPVLPNPTPPATARPASVGHAFAHAGVALGSAFRRAGVNTGAAVTRIF